jgi:peptidoglycan/LPS O-acetylase OafA/YrhL
LQYRKEIDGLRAIAIIPVIWSHSGLPFITGGFLGVDVFFVISGFLITAILLKDFESKSFSLLTFYERRARRILPALFTVIAVTSLILPFITTNPKFIGDFGASVLSTVLFFSNVYFWQTMGYFGSASELSPMLHTWSLAVEEQFYIFFPLLLMLVYRWGRIVIITALLLIAVFSLLISEWGATNSPTGNFYLLPSRAWELMAGALATLLYYNQYVIKLRLHYSSYVAGIGILLIFISYFFFTPSTLHPSSITLIPVLGTVLVLMFSDQNNIIGKVLSLKVLTMIGLISYSLYLWHQPILALMKYSYSGHLTPIQISIAIILTFVLSYLSWKFVENPFRNKKKFKSEKVIQYSLVSIVAFCILGLVLKQNIHIQKVFSPNEIERFETLMEAESSHLNQVMFDDNNCKFWSSELNDNFIRRFESCVLTHKKAIFILGGSHGMDLYNAIAMNTKNPFIVSVSRGYCRAHAFTGNANKLPRCQYQDFKKFASVYSDNISHVLYTQTPDQLFDAASMYEAIYTDLSSQKLEEVTKYLAELKEAHSLNVTMIGMLPPLRVRPLEWNYNEAFEERFDDIISQNAVDMSIYADKQFAAKLKIHDIQYISKFDAFSLSLPDDLIIDGRITYSDHRHISYTGEQIFGQRFVKYMLERGYLHDN